MAGRRRALALAATREGLLDARDCSSGHSRTAAGWDPWPLTQAIEPRTYGEGSSPTAWAAAWTSREVASIAIASRGGEPRTSPTKEALAQTPTAQHKPGEGRKA